jgi:hypothetical protein
MTTLKLGLALVGLVCWLPACSGGSEGGGDGDGTRSGGSAGSGVGGTGGTRDSTSGGRGGSTAGLGGGSNRGGAGTTGGSGGITGPEPCDTSDFEWEDPGCPDGYLRTFGEPICSNLYKCIVGVACAGLACDSCIETVAYGYAMNDVCVSGISAAELRDECLSIAQDYATAYPECTPEP